jgi:hypothetical protein
MEIDIKIKESARSVAQHLGAEAKRLGTGRDLQELRLHFYKLAHANLFPDTDLQAAAIHISHYLKQSGEAADPQVKAFADANDSLLKEIAGNENGITPPQKPLKSRR